MNKITSLLALVGVATFSSMQVSAQSFEGFYGQAGVGFQSVVPSLSGVTITAPSGTQYGYNSSIDSTNSFTGTAALGYSFLATPSFLVGIGAEYSPFAGQSGNIKYTSSTLTPSTINSTYKLNNTYNFYISPGIVIDKESVAYAKIGYAGASVNAGGSDSNSTGYSLGLGYKRFVSGNLYAFGEGNYMSFGNKTANGSGPWGGNGGGTYTSSVTSSANIYNFLVGIGYKF
jgi:outer membrane immunogenic protein